MKFPAETVLRKVKMNMQKFSTLIPWGHAPIIRKERRKKDVDISL